MILDLRSYHHHQRYHACDGLQDVCIKNGHGFVVKCTVSVCALYNEVIWDIYLDYEEVSGEGYCMYYATVTSC